MTNLTSLFRRGQSGVQIVQSVWNKTYLDGHKVEAKHVISVVGHKLKTLSKAYRNVYRGASWRRE